jgi:hypothetical protein
VNGIFTITTRTGDQLTGTYVGDVTAPLAGQPTATLRFAVIGGTGVFQGATGTFEGAGSGAFTGEGNFVLASLSGSVSLPTAPAESRFRLTIVGSSTLSCSPNNRIVLTLRGQGTVPMIGRVDAQLTSELERTTCFD